MSKAHKSEAEKLATHWNRVAVACGAGYAAVGASYAVLAEESGGVPDVTIKGMMVMGVVSLVCSYLSSPFRAVNRKEIVETNHAGNAITGSREDLDYLAVLENRFQLYAPDEMKGDIGGYCFPWSDPRILDVLAKGAKQSQQEIIDGITSVLKRAKVSNAKGTGKKPGLLFFVPPVSQIQPPQNIQGYGR